MVVTNEMIEAFIEDVKDGYADVGGAGNYEFFIDGIVNVREALTAALAVAPGVEVKPLEWKDVEFPDGMGSKATEPHSAWYFVNPHNGGWRIHFGTEETYPTLEAAKAAAQVDYTARIMSALTTTETNGYE